MSQDHTIDDFIEEPLEPAEDDTKTCYEMSLLEKAKGALLQAGVGIAFLGVAASLAYLLEAPQNEALDNAAPYIQKRSMEDKVEFYSNMRSQGHSEEDLKRALGDDYTRVREAYENKND